MESHVGVSDTQPTPCYTVYGIRYTIAQHVGLILQEVLLLIHTIQGFITRRKRMFYVQVTSVRKILY